MCTWQLDFQSSMIESFIKEADWKSQKFISFTTAA